jgi:carbon monoxide dehydrogenase subunit G
LRFENHFDVQAPIETVWAAMLDVERVAPTVPGAQVLEQTGEDAYKVAIKVKVGPMSMTYRGEVEITERDETAHRAVMKARAKESRGQGTADADVTMVLDGGNGTTSATVTTDVQLSGKVATMGQGVLQDVSGRLVKTFAQNLAAMLEGGAEQPGGPQEEAAGLATTPMPRDAGQPAAADGPASTGDASRSGTEAPPPAATAGATPSGQGPAPAPADALDLGSLGGAVVADRLRDPRALGTVLGVVALIAFLLGRRSARG